MRSIARSRGPCNAPRKPGIVAVAARERLILGVSDFVAKHPEISELDLNPVLAYPDGAIAVDARVVLAEA